MVLEISTPTSIVKSVDPLALLEDSTGPEK
jgi:hypothetical protein